MVSINALRDRVALKQTGPTIILVLTSFVWYILVTFLFNANLNGLSLIENQKTELLMVFFASIAISAIAGSKLRFKDRKNLLYLWSFIGTAATLCLTFLSGNDMPVNILVSFFLGFSIGFGLPSCLSYFADSTTHENRGVTAGIIWGIIGFTVLGIAFSTSSLVLWEMTLVLTAWRFLGGIGFLALTLRDKHHAIQKAPGYLDVIQKKEILLYLFPWIMFLLINFAEIPVLESAFNSVFEETTFSFLQLAEFVFIGIFAIIGGAVADRIGRKKIVIPGFIMLGIEYAIITVFSINSVTAYIFLILDGATWGLLYSVFLTVLWGDLGESYQKEKYYVLGGLPYILANVISLLIKPFASDIGTGAAFSFASFFLFLAVVPLMYAPETLPEKTIKDRELKNYIEKAQREVEKAQKKENEECLDETEDGNVEFTVNQEDMEKAAELAEKYY